MSVTQLPTDRDQLLRLPRSLSGYIWRGAIHQGALCLLAILVFLISAVPLELQRRIVDDAITNGAVRSIFWLAIAYLGVALTEGGIKLVMNIYRGWVSENAVRHLRRVLSRQIEHDARALHTADADSTVWALYDQRHAISGLAVTDPSLEEAFLSLVAPRSGES